jgi:hypothetical protein
MNCDKKINFDNNYRVIDIELDHLSEERNAFVEFTNRVEGLHSEDTAISKNKEYFTENKANTDISKRIKKIYAKTVVNISHYEEIYDETIRENMIHELGYDLYAAIDGASSLSSYLKNSLISAGTDAAYRRKQFKNVVKKEKRDISEFSRPLFSICDELSTIKTNSDILNIYTQLEELLAQCENIAMKRQKQIRSRRSVASQLYNGDFEEYLYSDLSSQYPILSLVSEFIAIIKDILPTEEPV